MEEVKKRGRPRKEPTPRIKDGKTLLTDTLYEAVKKRLNEDGIKVDQALYPALRKRVNDITEEVTDLNEVALVCLTIIDESTNFSAWKEFNWGHYEYVHDSLEVPDGAWQYALWAYELTNGKVRDSVNYWLGRWFDADQDGDESIIRDCKEKLSILWSKHKED